MSLTLITNEVIQTSSIGPDNLSFGAPRWSTSGILSATKFIGDGSGLTNVFPGLSVVEVTDTFFQITPDHNNAVLALNNSSDILLDLDFIGTFAEGHKTTLVQVNQGKGIIGFPTYNSSGYDRTQGIYSVGTLLYGGFSNGWTLYGDLTAQVLPDTTGNDGRATQLAVGERHSLVLAGNALYVAGWNNAGQLGLGSSLVNQSTFVKLSGVWTAIAAGEQFSLALSGTDLYSVGGNGGELGFGDTAHRSTFTKVIVPTDAKWTAIAAAGNSSFALSGTDLYATGYNVTGCLGLNDTNVRRTFTKVTVPANAKWTGVFAKGRTNSCFALSGSDLYACGYNQTGHLGLGDVEWRSTFTKISGNWSTVAVGGNSCFALSGTDLYATGSNYMGQLGLGDVVHRSVFTKITIPANGKWTSIAAADDWLLALSGTDLYVSGRNDQGGIGLGDILDRSTLTKVPGNWSLADGGDYHTLALSATGNQLFSTGRNVEGELGLGDTANRSTFTRVSGVYIEYSAPALPQFTQIAAGYYHALALSGTDLYAVGSANYGVLGIIPKSTKEVFTKVTIPTNAKWTAIAAGLQHSLALSGTDLYVTGRAGAIGLGVEGDSFERSTFTKVTIPTNAKWTDIAAGTGHSLALSGTDLYATGYNTTGELGLGDTFGRSTFTKVTIPTNAKWTAIAAGGQHSFALSGTDLYATGYNTTGELGLGDTVRRSTFTKVPGSWTAIAAAVLGTNISRSFALSGTDLYATGSNYFGTLGLGLSPLLTTIRSTFTKVTSPANAKWSAVGTGGYNSFALSGTDLYTCGSGVNGALGLGSTSDRANFTKVLGSWNAASQGYGYSLALSGTSLFVAGEGRFGLGSNSTVTTFTQVTAVGQ